MTIRNSAGQGEPPVDGVVHCWRIRLGETFDAAAAQRVLSADEIAKADRFHFSRDRHRYIRSHFALRTILARYAGTRAGSLAFNAGEFGKPHLQAGETTRSVEFNLSHSGDWAVVAVANRPVGIDVEQWDAGVEFLELATHFFSPAERAALGALAPGPDLMQGFFQAWSRKEAYLKATGVGISDGL
ncbi:MAG: 4'-phosphopantetheinyl transferase superfamily protein, partial [Phycisphaerae bacterium]|nr:4'-phosphopantetheinyl transferase superfamily protein [Gemmatimonadaceae bacterium]